MSETDKSTAVAAKPVPSLTRQWGTAKYTITVGGDCKIELKFSKNLKTRRTFTPNEVRKLTSNLDDAADYCEKLQRFAEENNPDIRTKTNKKTKKKIS